MKINDFFYEEKTRLDPACWTGKKIGTPKTKVKGGIRVNNCVPAESVAEGYRLKKTNVNKYMEPGDPDEYTQDINIKDTDYEIINNKTGQVVGTASWTTNDYFGPGALKITMKNGATRWLDIWEREKGNPQTAFNRFVKDPKTAKKYKEQGVAEGKWDPFTGGDYGQTPRPQRVGQDSQDNDIATPDKEKDQAEWEAMLDYYGTNALVQRALGDLYKQTHGSGYHDSVVTPERYLAIIEKTLGGRTTTEKKYFPNKQAAHKYAKSSFGHVVSFEKIDNKEDTADLITLPVMLGLGQQKKKWMLQFPDERYAQKWAFQHKNVATILWPKGHNLEKDVTEGMDNTSYTPKIGDEVLWRHSDPRSKMMPMPGTVLAVAPGKVKLKIYSKRMIQDRGTDTVVLDLTQYGITPKQGVAEGSVDKKPYPKTWHDVDPKIGKLVDKMSPEEKVKKGYANPSILKKKKEQGVAEGHGSEELANEVYAEFERTYPNLARRADERTVHAAIMDVLNYGGDSNPSALAQDVARAVKQEMQQGVAEGSEQEYKIYFVIPEHEDYPDRHEPTEQTIVLANSPGEAARKFKAETPEAYIKDIIPLGQQGVAKGKIDFAKKLQKNVDKSNKAVVKTRQDIGSRIADIGAGGKEYNVKTDAAWDAAKKKVAEGSAPKEKQKTPYRDINSPEYKAAADKQKEKMAKDKEAEPGKKLADKIDNKKK